MRVGPHRARDAVLDGEPHDVVPRRRERHLVGARPAAVVRSVDGRLLVGEEARLEALARPEGAAELGAPGEEIAGAEGLQALDHGGVVPDDVEV
ncbi:MAG: hypothetical protein H0V81_02295, partial [Solirubrobacterales bacterium]|nr:hypothetical protein [Solirubrobacterales bacterium]